MAAAVRSRRVRVLAGLVALQLTGSVAVALLLQPSRADTPPPVALAQARPVLPPPSSAPEQARDAVVRLLAARGRAVLNRDRAAFLATVDPVSGAFRTRQARLFDAVADVPLAAWSYELEPGAQAPSGATWQTRITFRHALRGVDAEPVETPQDLALVRRAAGWYVSGEAAAAGDRFLWDSGPVVAVRGTASLVLGHPAQREELRRLAEEVDAAVPRVTAVWGTGWSRRVAVLVPSSQSELGTLVHTRGGLGTIAALAVAGPVRSGATRGGDRVLVNPPNLARLGALGRRVVLTHEVTHIAARAATGPSTPSWLAEGLADHVGLAGSGLPRAIAAQALGADVRAGRVPAQLPRDGDFSGDNPALPQAYEASWLAVELLVQQYGQARVLGFYRALGKEPAGDGAAALDRVLRRELGTGTPAFTAAWRSWLRDTLA